MNRTTLLAGLALLALGSNEAGALQSAHGNSKYLRSVKMACDNPQQILQVQTSKNGLAVVQSGPSGTRWDMRLPAAAGKTQSYLSPDGQAALIITNVDHGRGFLVTGNEQATPIDDAYVHAVDFRAGRALVATLKPQQGRQGGSVRVRVYDLQRGGLLGDTRIDDWDSFDIWTLERDWHIKLSEDGRAYFYVREHDLPAGSRPELVVRDARSGARTSFPLAQLRGPSLQTVYDAVLPTPETGYVATGKGVYAINAKGPQPLVVSGAGGGPETLVYSSKARQIGVAGTGNWGARVHDLGNGAWHVLEPGRGYALDLKETGGGWTVVDESPRNGGIRHYDVTASGARVLRRLSDARAGHPEVACANAYGLMRQEGKRFRWHPTK